MANVLLTWELGAGLGHLMRLKPIAEWLAGHSHSLTLATRDLHRAEAIYADTNCQAVQAPFKKGKYEGGFDPPSSFGHVLFNTCFGDTDELGERVRQWQELYREVNPSLVIFDHSPTALLAARSFDFQRATIGTGFCCPPPTDPLPVLRTWRPLEDSQLRQDEARTLHNVNTVSAAIRQRPLGTLGELYADVDEVLLATFEELDHFPQRADGEYLGAWPQDSGKVPEWPNGYGPRIFAYLKRFQILPKLIEHPAQLRMPTIVYSHGIDDYLSEYCTANYPSIRFESQPQRERLGWVVNP
ncbi:MAG: hypothetical protein H6822_24060 [Planctomycetaceae bacterium]|nr:hypothetical protein [Planctomycetales bacterium]MCB9925274.1 hypothetical protein [Planctomycetaceae bacterium]